MTKADKKIFRAELKAATKGVRAHFPGVKRATTRLIAKKLVIKLYNDTRLDVASDIAQDADNA